MFYVLSQCYYLGASSDAATRVTASVSRPLAFHVPVEKICQRLSSSDTQICQLRYGNVCSNAQQRLTIHFSVHKTDKSVSILWLSAEPQLKDLSSDGLKKLRVVELRNILASWGEECRGCLEKHEFVSLIQEKAPLHAHSMEL